ncbi:response regulator [Micromonospora sp. DT62]|uniref:response regulator n=1 Tax=Micromonospora sp. DT62 TaxID=3416521 RepID=UPI003CEC107F
MGHRSIIYGHRHRRNRGRCRQPWSWACPGVVLLDLRMPRRDGIWVLRRLRERGADVPALVLTTFDDDTLVLDALRAGGRGYLLKDVTLEQLTRASCGSTDRGPRPVSTRLGTRRCGPRPAPAGDHTGTTCYLAAADGRGLTRNEPRMM